MAVTGSWDESPFGERLVASARQAALMEQYRRITELGRAPTRLIVHDAETRAQLTRDLPRTEYQGPLWGLRLEIDPEDAPEPGMVYVDYRPASEWANRRG